MVESERFCDVCGKEYLVSEINGKWVLECPHCGKNSKEKK